MSSAVVCSGLSFDWPDGTTVFHGIDAAFPGGRTGLIGLNGSGKSTLLRLIVGELTPSGGTVDIADPDGSGIGYLSQRVTLDVDRSMSDLLGITEKRMALHAIEAGDVTEANLATVDDDWEVEDRARAALRRFGVSLEADTATGGAVDLDRTVATLSGGEAVLAGLAGLALRRPAVTLLDEPTNNLDGPARARLYDAVEGWRGVLIVVSHDRELLARVDQIAELREERLRTYGGGFPAYTAQVAAEQEAAERMVRVAEGDVRRERRQLAEARVKLDRRVRYGAKMNAQKREPKVVMGERKRQAQVSAGKHRIMQTEKVEQARRTLAEARDAVRDDDHIRVDLPGTGVHAGRAVLRLHHTGATLTMRGPERVALVGRNGSGKTTLLGAITGETPHPSVTVDRGVDRVGYLPQRLDVLDDSLSVLENMHRAAPSSTPHEVRAGMARFLIRGESVERPAGTLSGGERFRVALARILLADPPPHLLILDEPTNDLDLHSIGHLTDALAAYRGALLVASHDHTFLRDVGITRWWSMDTHPGPVEVAERS